MTFEIIPPAEATYTQKATQQTEGGTKEVSLLVKALTVEQTV